MSLHDVRTFNSVCCTRARLHLQLYQRFLTFLRATFISTTIHPIYSRLLYSRRRDVLCHTTNANMSYQCAMSHEAAEIVHCMRFNELATEPIGKFAKTCTYLPYYADIASWNIWQKMRLTFLLIGCIHDTFMVQIMSFLINLVSAIAVKLLRTLN